MTAALPCPRSYPWATIQGRIGASCCCLSSLGKSSSQPCSVRTERERGCCTPSIPLCVPWCVPWRCWFTPQCYQQLSAGRRGAPCPAPSTVTTIPHSEGMRTVPAGARHHHSSPGPGNSTGPRVPPGFFSLPAWEASQCRDSAGEILSSVGSRDGPAERLRQGHSCGSGRHQMFPRQLAEAEPCCGVGHTVPFAVGPWSKGGQGWWSPKSHQATRKPQVMPQEFHPCRWWESRFPASYHIATLTQTFLFAERV